MIEWQEHKGLRWRELDPFGVEIDCDFSKPLSEEEGKQFAQLFFEFGLVVAHQQNLTPEQQQSLMTWIGPLLLREGERGYISNEGDHIASKSAYAFHADAAYTDHPFDALSLHAVDVVDGASSTRFANAVRACERLPAELLEQLRATKVEMISGGLETLAIRCCDVRNPDTMQRGVQPAVMVHPHTGKECLWVSEMHAACLLDMEWDHSRELLHEVYEHLYAPENMTEHRWSMGDIVIWDNHAFQHARGSLQHVGRRVLQRALVGTEGKIPHITER